MNHLPHHNSASVCIRPGAAVTVRASLGSKRKAVKAKGLTSPNAPARE
ncbi:MAG: hypothetical protein RL689_1845 [Planctomycetota bacterium]|jgi:hypothetical protein